MGVTRRHDHEAPTSDNDKIDGRRALHAHEILHITEAGERAYTDITFLYIESGGRYDFGQDWRPKKRFAPK